MSVVCVQLSPVTVSELVESSPSLSVDGSAIVGSLSTTLYYIDSKTGKLLKTVSDVDLSKLVNESVGMCQWV